MVHDEQSAAIRFDFALPHLSPAGIMFGRDQTPIFFFQTEIFHTMGLHYMVPCKFRC
jgi:hypothetical protein